MVRPKSKKSKSRRSSILKSTKPQQSMQNANSNPNSFVHDDSPITPKQKRRVSFAEKKHVKEFVDSVEQGTLWDNTYEEHDLSNATASNAIKENAITKDISSTYSEEIKVLKNVVGTEYSAKGLRDPTKSINACTYNIVTRESSDLSNKSLELTSTVDTVKTLITHSNSLANNYTVHHDINDDEIDNLANESNKTCVQDVPMEVTEIPINAHFPNMTPMTPMTSKMLLEDKENIPIPEIITQFLPNINSNCVSTKTMFFDDASMEITQIVKSAPFREESVKEREDFVNQENEIHCLNRTELLDISMDITDIVPSSYPTNTTNKLKANINPNKTTLHDESMVLTEAISVTHSQTWKLHENLNELKNNECHQANTLKALEYIEKNKIFQNDSMTLTAFVPAASSTHSKHKNFNKLQDRTFSEDKHKDFESSKTKIFQNDSMTLTAFVPAANSIHSQHNFYKLRDRILAEDKNKDFESSKTKIFQNDSMTLTAFVPAANSIHSQHNFYKLRDRILAEDKNKDFESSKTRIFQNDSMTLTSFLPTARSVFVDHYDCLKSQDKTSIEERDNIESSNTRLFQNDSMTFTTLVPPTSSVHAIQQNSHTLQNRIFTHNKDVESCTRKIIQDTSMEITTAIAKPLISSTIRNLHEQGEHLQCTNIETEKTNVDLNSTRKRIKTTIDHNKSLQNTSEKTTSPIISTPISYVTRHSTYENRYKQKHLENAHEDNDDQPVSESNTNTLNYISNKVPNLNSEKGNPKKSDLTAFVINKRNLTSQSTNANKKLYKEKSKNVNKNNENCKSLQQIDINFDHTNAENKNLNNNSTSPKCIKETDLILTRKSELLPSQTKIQEPHCDNKGNTSNYVGTQNNKMVPYSSLQCVANSDEDSPINGLTSLISSFVYAEIIAEDSFLGKMYGNTSQSLELAPQIQKPESQTSENKRTSVNTTNTQCLEFQKKLSLENDKINVQSNGDNTDPSHQNNNSQDNVLTTEQQSRKRISETFVIIPMIEIDLSQDYDNNQTENAVLVINETTKKVYSEKKSRHRSETFVIEPKRSITNTSEHNIADDDNNHSSQIIFSKSISSPDPEEIISAGRSNSTPIAEIVNNVHFDSFNDSKNLQNISEEQSPKKNELKNTSEKKESAKNSLHKEATDNAKCNISPEDNFLSLVHKLKMHANSDDCIWDLHHENIEKQLLVVAFMSASLLVVIYVQNDTADITPCTIRDIKLISRLKDKTEPSINIAHKLLMEKVNVQTLRQSYKYGQDILFMLNRISEEVKLTLDFIFDLKKLSCLNLMEITKERISFTSMSKHMDIILKVSVNVKPFNDTQPSDVTVHYILGTVSENDVKELIRNVTRDYKFIRRYMSDVRDYINLMEKTNRVNKRKLW